MGAVVLALEGIPQLLIVAAGQVHWDGDYNIKSLKFFISFVDIPLILWYLSFYCNERTKYAVIGKIINLAVMNSASEWVDFVEYYIYDEKEEIEMGSSWGANSTDTVKGYDVAKPWKVMFYQIAYILASPLLGKSKTWILLN